MQAETNETTQLTFFYLNGQTETFLFPGMFEDETSQDLKIEVRHILQKDWWVLHLPEQTVLVNIANVVKVEVKPSFPQFRGEGIFDQVERVTALNRAR